MIEGLERRTLCSAGTIALLKHKSTTPTISIVATDASATEGGESGTVRLTRSGSTSASLTVKLAWGGSAKKKDLSKQPHYATFDAGASTVSVVVRAIDDHVAEKTETAMIRVASGSGYVVSSSASNASVLVYDAAETVEKIAWSATTPDLAPDTEAQTAVLNGIFYRFGGYDGNYSAVRRVDRYDPATKAWTQMSDMPVGLTHAGTAVVGADEVWFAGAFAERVGSPGQQDIGVRDVWIYHVASDTWTAGPDLPAARGSGGLANVNGVLYFISGEEAEDRDDTTTVWAYDPSHPSAGWVTKASIPQGRSHFGCVVVDARVYVFGGQVFHDAAGEALKTAYVYDPATDAWTRLADMPNPMSHLAPASFAYEGKIYSFGGDCPYNVPSDQARVYDPATDVWRLLNDLPVSRLAMVAGVIGYQFIISGGHSPQAEWTSDTFLGTLDLG